MCWISKEIPVKKVAKEDMKVFKVFRVYDDVISSPVYDYIVWKRGEIKENELEKPILTRSGVWKIYIGLHSLRIEPKISVSHFSLLIAWYIGDKELFTTSNKGVVLNCVIPKGSEYYENEEGEIVSNKLMLV